MCGRTREIQNHLLAIDMHINSNRQCLVLDAVIIKIVGRGHITVGKGADMGLHLQMCTRAQFGKDGGNCVIPIFVQQGVQPAMTQIKCADLRVQVAIDRQRQARIGAQD